MSEQSFRAPQVCEITGISKRQIIYWASEGILRSSIEHAPHSGYQHKYSYNDVFAALTIKELCDNGLDIWVAATAIKLLLKADLVAIRSSYLVIADNEAWLADNTQELLDYLATAKGVHTLVSISELLEVLDRQINRIESSLRMSDEQDLRDYIDQKLSEGFEKRMAHIDVCDQCTKWAWGFSGRRCPNYPTGF